MTSTADPAISALRAVHGALADRVAGYDDAALARTSGATEWTVAQVLSHLGSGAEIASATLQAATTGSPPPGDGFAPTVWARWNAMTPREQADAFVAADAALVASFEALDEATRTDVRVSLGFLPQPIGVDAVAAMRLNEAALHAWDVAVADDADAAVHPDAVPVLVDALAGPLAFLVGFAGRPGPTSATLAVTTSDPERRLTLVVGEQVSVRPGEPPAADGTLTLPAQAWLLLFAGRLGEDRGAVDATVSGPLDLAALRATFPGY